MRWCKICGQRVDFRPGPIEWVDRCPEHSGEAASPSVVAGTVGCGLLLGLIWGLVIVAAKRFFFG